MKRNVPHRSSRPSIGALTDGDSSSSENSDYSQYTKETKKKLKAMVDDESDIDVDYKPTTDKEDYNDDTSDAVSAGDDDAENKQKVKQVKKKPKVSEASSVIHSDGSHVSDSDDDLSSATSGAHDSDDDLARITSGAHDSDDEQASEDGLARVTSAVYDSDTTDTSVEDNPPPRQTQASRKAAKLLEPHPDGNDLNTLYHCPKVLSKALLSAGGREPGLHMYRNDLLDLITSFVDRGDGDTAMKLFSKFLGRSPKFIAPDHMGHLVKPVYEFISEMVVSLIRTNIGPEMIGEAMKQVNMAVSIWANQGGRCSAKPYMMVEIIEVLLDTGNIDWLCHIMKDCAVVPGRQRHRREGVLVRRGRAVTMMMEDLGHGGRDDDLRSLGGMSVTSSLAPDTVMGDLGPMFEECEDGSLDWLMGLYAGFIGEKKGTKAAIEILEKYRDKNQDCFSSHQLLLDFLEKNRQTSRPLLLECLRKLADAFPWHSKVFDYCDMLLKEEAVNNKENKDSDEDMDEDDEFLEMDENSGDEFTNKTTKEPIEDLDKDAKYLEVVERLVNLLDYPELKDSLKVWGLLADSLRRLYQDEKTDDKMEDIFKTRFPWWFDKNFSFDDPETYTDYTLNVVAKKMIVAAYLLGKDCIEFCSGLAVLEMNQNSWKNEVFAYVDTIYDPLLNRKEYRQTNFDDEINEEWDLIKIIKNFPVSKPRRTIKPTKTYKVKTRK